MIPVDRDSSLDREILPALLRYRDGHRWSWNLSMRLINMYHGTQYTEKQLKALYRSAHTDTSFFSEH